MNSRKLRRLIPAAVIFAALLGVLLYMSRKGAGEAENGPKEAEEGTREQTLISGEADEIESAAFVQGETSFQIVREEDGLHIPQLDAYAQDQERLRRLFGNLGRLSAVLVHGEMEDPAVYGLEQPQMQVTVTEKGAAAETLYLGDYNESSQSWYLAKEGDRAVYAISGDRGDLLKKPSYHYLDTMFIQPFAKGEEMTQRLRAVTIERPDLDSPIEIKALEEEPKPYTSAYEIVSPVHVQTSYKAMNEQIGSLFGFAAEEAVGRYSGEEAPEYGFDRPALRLTVEHDGRLDRFVIGSQSAQGKRWMYREGEELLYVVPESRLAFLHADVNSLFFGLALLPDIETISEVEVTLEGETILYRLRRDEAGELIEVRADGGAVREAAPVDLKQFRVFYSLLLAIDVQQVSRQKLPEDAQERLSILYRYRDGGEDEIKEYQLSDGRTGAVTINGEESFTGRTAYLQKLQAEQRKLLAGEKVDTDW